MTTRSNFSMSEVFADDWKLDEDKLARRDEWTAVGIADDDPDALFMEVDTESATVPLSVVAELMRRAGWTVVPPTSPTTGNHESY